uniref:Calcineurin-like phosphoesterase n=1 Tax=viral metagenome TaxID=1070528 RepID=A0A6M3J859_9ZZZZ
MNTKDIDIPYKNSSSEFRLYALGDIHAGTIHCVEEYIQRKVREIKEDRNTYWIGMGDYAEWITPKDKRFDPAQKVIADWVEPDNIAETQTKWLVNLLSPIKNKCVGLLYGNHEDSIRMYNHDNVQKNLCERLGVDNLGYSCFLRLFFHRDNSKETHLVKGAFTHGASGAVTEGAKLMALMRFMKAFESDIYGYAHVHDYIPKALSRMTIPDSSRVGCDIQSKVTIGCTTGSWFRTYTQGVIASYGERKAYPPTEICCAKYIINPNTGELDVHKSA